MRGRPIALAALTAAILAIEASGCGGQDRVPQTPDSASSASHTHKAVAAPLVTANPQGQARKAYLSMWDAFVIASGTADYRAPNLAQYAVGGALSVLTHGLYMEYVDGIVTRGRPAFRPQVTVTPTAGAAQQARVIDCADTSTWANYTRSGKLISGQPHGSRRIIARLQLFRQAGGPKWKVTYLNVGQPGTC